MSTETCDTKDVECLAKSAFGLGSVVARLSAVVVAALFLLLAVIQEFAFGTDTALKAGIGWAFLSVAVAMVLFSFTLRIMEPYAFKRAVLDTLGD